MSKSKKTIICISLILLLATLVEIVGGLRKNVNSVHMQFLYGVMPNFLTVMIISFACSVVSSKGFSYAVGFTIGTVFYEFMQILIPGRTFDLFDILASCLGFLFYLLMRKIYIFRAFILNE